MFISVAYVAANWLVRKFRERNETHSIQEEFQFIEEFDWEIEDIQFSGLSKDDVFGGLDVSDTMDCELVGEFEYIEEFDWEIEDIQFSGLSEDDVFGGLDVSDTMDCELVGEFEYIEEFDWEIEDIQFSGLSEDDVFGGLDVSDTMDCELVGEFEYIEEFDWEIEDIQFSGLSEDDVFGGLDVSDTMDCELVGEFEYIEEFDWEIEDIQFSGLSEDDVFGGLDVSDTMDCEFVGEFEFIEEFDWEIEDIQFSGLSEDDVFGGLDVSDAQTNCNVKENHAQAQYHKGEVNVDPKRHKHFVSHPEEVLREIGNEKGAKDCVEGAKKRFREIVADLDTGVTVKCVFDRTGMGGCGANVQEITKQLNVGIERPVANGGAATVPMSVLILLRIMGEDDVYDCKDHLLEEY